MDALETWNFYQGLYIMSDIVSSVVKQSEAAIVAENTAVSAIKALTAEVANLNKNVSGVTAGISAEDTAALEKVVKELGASTAALTAATGVHAAPTLGHGLILEDIRADAKDVVEEVEKVLPSVLYYAAIFVGGCLLFLAGSFSHCYFFCR